MLDFLIPLPEKDLVDLHMTNLVVRPLDGGDHFIVTKNRWGKLGILVDERWLRAHRSFPGGIHVLVKS